MRTANETPGRLANAFAPAQGKAARRHVRRARRELRRLDASIKLLLDRGSVPSTATMASRALVRARVPGLVEEADADFRKAAKAVLETQLPIWQELPMVHAALLKVIRGIHVPRVATAVRRSIFLAQRRDSVAPGHARMPRRRQARARRVRCAKRQTDSGGDGDGDGDGPPADGPPGPLRGRGSYGAFGSSPARLAFRFAPSAASPRQKDGTERRTLQRRHRRQGGAELRGTAYRLDTHSPFQPIDAPEAPQVESGASGVGGAAPLSYGLCAETRQQVGRSVPLLARGLVCCGPRSRPASQISRGQSSNGGAKC